MSELSQRVNVYVNRFLNIKCRHCKTDLTGEPCIGKSHGRRYCLSCAILLKIISKKDCLDSGFELPLKKIITLHQKGILSTSQLKKEYDISRSELIQCEVVN